MNKDTEIKFVGQPVFGQILKLVDKSTFIELVKQKKSDYYYKAFGSWDHLVTMLFGILSRCDSMSETCEGIRALSGKMNHLGLKKAPAKSTAGDGLRNRDSSFFEALYYKLVERYKGFLPRQVGDIWTNDKRVVDSRFNNNKIVQRYTKRSRKKPKE
jgi:hypothetical protein